MDNVLLTSTSIIRVIRTRNEGKSTWSTLFRDRPATQRSTSSYTECCSSITQMLSCHCHRHPLGTLLSSLLLHQAVTFFHPLTPTLVCKISSAKLPGEVGSYWTRCSCKLQFLTLTASSMSVCINRFTLSVYLLRKNSN